MNKGSHLPHAKFSFQYLKFSLRYTMMNMFGMFSIVFWPISTLKCDVVNFLKFKSGGIPLRPLEYLGTPISLRACMPCMHAHDMYAQCDITRFTNDTNHVTLMSPAFTFHSCHIGMRWHDVIGVCIVGTPCHHGLHHMGMTYNRILSKSKG